MQIILKRTNRPVIKLNDADRHDVGVLLHMAATANNDGDLEMIQICNDLKDPVTEIKI